MFITITKLKMVTGAQMLLWQGCGGLFINADTLVYEAQDTDDDTLDLLKAAMPSGTVYPSSAAEIDLWHQRRQVYANRRTVASGDPASSRPHRQHYTQLRRTDGSLYPDLAQGTKVITTKSKYASPEHEKRDITPEGIASRRWAVLGEITYFHDSHGLCYVVMHEDGTTGLYHVEEFAVVN